MDLIDLRNLVNASLKWLLLAFGVAVILVGDLLPAALKKWGSVLEVRVPRLYRWLVPLKDKLTAGLLKGVVLLAILFLQAGVPLRVAVQDVTDSLREPKAEWQWLVSSRRGPQLLSRHAQDSLWASGRLVLMTTMGDLWGPWDGPDAGQLLMRRISDADFMTVATLRGFAPRRNFQQAGIAVVADQDNYVRITVAASNLPGEGSCEGKPKGRVIIQAVSEVLGTVEERQAVIADYSPACGDSVDDRPGAGDTVVLKVLRHGDTYEFGYSWGKWSSRETRFFTLMEGKHTEGGTNVMHNPMTPRWAGLIAFKGGPNGVREDQIPVGDHPDSNEAISATFTELVIRGLR